jgi:hypothetical protein
VNVKTSVTGCRRAEAKAGPRAGALNKQYNDGRVAFGCHAAALSNIRFFLVKVVDIFAVESDTEHIFLELNNTFCFITSYFISEEYGYECRKDASKRE